MPFDFESMKSKLKKRTELKEKVKSGLISKIDAKNEARTFNRTLDKYGICDPDIVAHWNLDDVD